MGDIHQALITTTNYFIHNYHIMKHAGTSAEEHYQNVLVIETQQWRQSWHYHLWVSVVLTLNRNNAGRVVSSLFIMMTSSNGNIFRVTGPLCGEFTGPGEFPAQRPVTRSFDVFFHLRLNKRLSKQPWGWWFETPGWSLWRHRNVVWKKFPYYWPFVRGTTSHQRWIPPTKG